VLKEVRFRLCRIPNSLRRPQWSNDFRDILAEELKRVGEEVSDADPDPIKYAHQKQLVGLAFSGGGIRARHSIWESFRRSREMKLLSKFDYLSTGIGRLHRKLAHGVDQT